MIKMFDLKDKVIIVTGSNRGNGLAISNGLKNARAKVIGIDLKFDTQNSDNYEFDLLNTKLLKDLILDIHKKNGSIDGLVNNAGVSIESSSPYDDKVTYKKTLDINLNAAFELSSNVLPIMAENGSGSIVNITSLGAELGFANNPSYQISKAGLRQMTRALAKDWGSSGIRVNNICPGYIKTSMTQKSFDDPELYEVRRNKSVLGRWGNSKDLVGPSIFLLSDASSFITGSDIYVDGGWTSNAGI